MLKYIYQIKEKIYKEQIDENLEYELKEIEPKFLSSVYCIEPLLTKRPIIDDNGYVIEEEDYLPKFNIQDFYPNFDNEIMVYKDNKLTRPIYKNGELREMTREEICETGDLSILIEGEVYQDDVIIYKEPPKGLKIEWEYPNWVEKATQQEIDLKAVREQYEEYEPMDTPLTFIRLEEQGLKEEYISMMKQLQELIVQLETQIQSENSILMFMVKSNNINIPKASQELEEFKNKFKLI